jgi:hypothetical protein
MSPPICDEQRSRPGIASNGSDPLWAWAYGIGDEVGIQRWCVSIMKRRTVFAVGRDVDLGGCVRCGVAAVAELGPGHDVQAVGRAEPELCVIA